MKRQSTPDLHRRCRLARLVLRPAPAAFGIFLSAFVGVSGCAGSRPGATAAPLPGIEEPSGVARQGDRLLIVGDHEPGTYYSFSVEGDESGRLPLDPARLSRYLLSGGPYALDLESIGVLADGRVVALSEHLAALLDHGGIVARYGRTLAQIGGRGLEGMAIRAAEGGGSQVAVIWEGGYPEPAELPAALHERLAGRALRPAILLHEVPAGASGLLVREGRDGSRIELSVPLPPGREPTAQRFRAPDLVWHRWEQDGVTSWGFIVLLSSGCAEAPAPGSIDECPRHEAGEPRQYCHRWLQRFTLAGKPFGEPFDLDPVLPEPLRTANWEGLAWFVPGESLVLVYDERLAQKRVDPQEAFILLLPAGW